MSELQILCTKIEDKDTFDSMNELLEGLEDCISNYLYNAKVSTDLNQKLSEGLDLRLKFKSEAFKF